MLNLKKKKKFLKLPSVFTIIIIIMLLIVFVSWIPGAVPNTIDITANGKKTTYHPHRLGIFDVFHAMLYGIETRGGIIAFIFAIGAYIYFILDSKALDAGVGVMLKKLKGKEIFIIPVFIIFFGLSGSIYNMCEETVAYYPVLLPIMIFAGFDVITTVMVITFGAGMGVLGSTIAPFSVIIGSSTLGTSAADGLIWRLIIFLACMGLTITVTLFYAIKVKKDPTKSIVYYRREEHKKHFGHIEELPEFTLKRKIICVIFVVTFLLMVLIELPWNTFLNISDDSWYGQEHKVGLVSLALSKAFPFLFTSIFSSQDGGLFIDLATLFFIASLIIGFMNWKGEEKHIEKTLTGAKDLFGVALIVSTAGGVAILLDNNHTAFGYTLGESISNLVNHMSAPAFLVVCFIAFIPISFLIPSTSGFAISILPLFKTAATNLHCQSGLVTSYVCAEGWINLFTPAGLPMACVMIAKISYKDFLKGTWPLILGGFLIPLIFIPFGAAVLPNSWMF